MMGDRVSTTRRHSRNRQNPVRHKDSRKPTFLANRCLVRVLSVTAPGKVTMNTGCRMATPGHTPDALQLDRSGSRPYMPQDPLEFP